MKDIKEKPTAHMPQCNRGNPESCAEKGVGGGQGEKPNHAARKHFYAGRR